MIQGINKLKLWFIVLAILITGILALYITQKSVAKNRLLVRYTQPLISECGAGGAIASSPQFELRPALFGYYYRLENSDHMIVKGNISFAGTIHEKNIEQIHCALL